MVALHPNIDSRRGRVLVVDDDPKFAGIVVRCLDRAGYECVVADSGDQALLAVREHDPDAIVLDVMMPPPDGIEVCRQLRADGWTGGIVMVSARSNPSDRDVAKQVNADEFLGKPFPLAELVSAINTLVGPERSRQ
jgi:two-component system, OmpR family, response regulator